MSTRAVNMIVPGADHYIQFDHPQVVIDAVIQPIKISKEQRNKIQRQSGIAALSNSAKSAAGRYSGCSEGGEHHRALPQRNHNNRTSE
jgi:hypothetical protein